MGKTVKNRGVKEILIAAVVGLKGFPDAINTVFPNAEVQLCIIHQIRNSISMASKDRKAFAASLKTVYSAPTEKTAPLTLGRLKKHGQRRILW